MENSELVDMLRQLQDKIDKLSSNVITGFTPRAMELIRNRDWNALAMLDDIRLLTTQEYMSGKKETSIGIIDISRR